MESPLAVSYRKVRDLSEVFSSVFAFLRTNYKVFFGSLLVFAGPFQLIGGLAMGQVLNIAVFVTHRRYSSFNEYRPDSTADDFAFYYAMAVLFTVAGLTVFVATVNKNVIQSEKQVTGEEPYSVTTVRKSLFGNYFRLLGQMVLLYITMALSLAIIVLFIGAAASVLTLFSSDASPVLLWMYGIFIFALVVVLTPFVGFVPVAAFFVSQRDRINIYSAMGKVFSYIRGRFWKTWTVAFIALLTYAFLIGLTSLPAIIVMVIRFAFSRGSHALTEPGTTAVLFTLFIAGISALIGYAINAVYYLMCIYHFGSIEENREGRGLLQRINDIK